MTVPALWTKHRPLALAIARDFWFPGADREDVQQEALIALWEACRVYKPERGPFPPFARLVVKRRLGTCLRGYLRHRLFSIDVEDAISPEDEGFRDDVRELVAALPSLTDGDRAALRRIVNAMPLQGKADDVARYRVRKKLREAA